MKNTEHEDLVGSVENMIGRIARRRMRDFPEADILDVMQNTRIHLLHHVSPRFDASRGVRWSSFAFPCIRAFIGSEVRRLQNARNKCVSVDVLDSRVAPDRSEDSRIERLADLIQQHPERFLTAAQVNVFRLMMENPGMPKAELARLAGYDHACNLSKMMLRIRQRITDQLAQFEG